MPADNAAIMLFVQWRDGLSFTLKLQASREIPAVYKLSVMHNTYLKKTRHCAFYGDMSHVLQMHSILAVFAPSLFHAEVLHYSLARLS